MRDTISQCSVMCTVHGLVVQSIKDGREHTVQNMIVTVQNFSKTDCKTHQNHHCCKDKQ